MRALVYWAHALKSTGIASGTRSASRWDNVFWSRNDERRSRFASCGSATRTTSCPGHPRFGVSDSECGHEKSCIEEHWHSQWHPRFLLTRGGWGSMPQLGMSAAFWSGACCPSHPLEYGPIMICGHDEPFALSLLWLRHLDNKLSRPPDRGHDRYSIGVWSEHEIRRACGDASRRPGRLARPSRLRRRLRARGC